MKAAIRVVVPEVIRVVEVLDDLVEIRVAAAHLAVAAVPAEVVRVAEVPVVVQEDLAVVNRIHLNFTCYEKIFVDDNCDCRCNTLVSK
jgi:hypothetical protein